MRLSAACILLECIALVGKQLTVSNFIIV